MRHRNIRSFLFHFLPSATAVFDASANVFVSPTKLSDFVQYTQLGLFTATITAVRVLYPFDGDETRHMSRLRTHINI